jgi:hypothetical protein
VVRAVLAATSATPVEPSPWTIRCPDSYRVPVRAHDGRRSIHALAIVFALMFTGCAAHADTTAPLPPGNPELPTSGAGHTTAAEAETASVPAVNRTDPLAVYREWWAAVQAAFAHGDADYPPLAIYGVDPILSNERNQIRLLRAQGIVQRTRLELTPRVLHQDDTVAEIADCLRGPAGTYRDAVTGKPRAPRGYSNDVPTRDALLVSLQKRGDYWYVVAATSEGVQPC